MAIWKNWVQTINDRFHFLTQLCGKSFKTVLIYVDDMITTHNDVVAITILKRLLNEQVRLKDLNKSKHFLGIELAYFKEGISIKESLLSCYAHETKSKIYLAKTSQRSIIVQKPNWMTYLPYNHRVGYRLVYRLSQFMHYPRKPHILVVIRVVRYLKRTFGQGILFPKKKMVWA